MNIQIDPIISNRFPGVKIGVVIAQGVNNKNTGENIQLLTRKAEADIRKIYRPENIALIPKINDWRQAYRSFGCKPSEYRSSIEALLRRILNGKELPTINPIVDLYNLISIKYLLPAGGGNLDKVKGAIRLTVAQGDEYFVMLGTSTPTPLQPGEVVYRDDKEVLCRAWNYRESDTTKITHDTHNVYLLLEGLQSTGTEDIACALSELSDLISVYCGGTISSTIQFF